MMVYKWMGLALCLACASCDDDDAGVDASAPDMAPGVDMAPEPDVAVEPDMAAEPDMAVEAEPCRVLAERTVACTVEVCAPLAETDLDIAAAFDVLCRNALDRGEIDPAGLGRLSPETPCADPDIAALVDSLTADDPETGTFGTLAAICRGEPPVRTAELCAPACAAIAPCVTPDLGEGAQRLVDEPVCQLTCRTLEGEIPEAVWACVAELEPGDCDGVMACRPER